MKLYVLWVKTKDDDLSPWAQECVDEYTEENLFETPFSKEIAEAQKRGDEYRIVTYEIGEMDEITKLFDVPDMGEAKQVSVDKA